MAQRRSAVIRHTYPLDYRIKASSPESVNVSFTALSSGTPTNLPSDVLVPIGTSITSDDDSIPYITTANFTMSAGQSVFSIPFSQLTNQTNVLLGTTDGTANQRLTLPDNYVQGSIALTIGGTTYNNVDSWAEQEFDATSFIIEVAPNNSIQVELGDNVRGLLPSAGLEVRANLSTTLGPNGRIESNQLTTAPGITLPTGFTLQVNNSTMSSGGSFIESTEDIRSNSIYARRANARMVTKGDYRRLIQGIAGVAKATVSACCSRVLDIYIVPEGGGIASQALVDMVDAQVDDDKMVGRNVNIFTSGETVVSIAATVTAKVNRSLAQTQIDVQNALLEYGSEANQEINRAVRLSEISTVIQTLDNVEFVDLTEVFGIPFARPQSHGNALVWGDQIVKVASDRIREWRLTYNAGKLYCSTGSSILGQRGGGRYIYR